MINRFAVHFQHTLINYQERDGDPYDHIEMAIAHAKLKADAMIQTSVNKIKIIEQKRDNANQTFKIVFGFTHTGKPTGAVIEVRPMPKHQQSNATGLRETYAGIIIGD